MRILRLLVLVIVAVLVPFSTSRAQTCQGVASFADGKSRIGADYQGNDNFTMWRAGWAHGADKSWYGGLSVDGTQLSHGGSSSTGFGGSLGYQVPLGDSQWEFCPAVTAHYQSGGGVNTTALGLNGSIGYRIAASDNVAFVPAAGLRWVSSNTSGGGGSTTTDNVFIALGFVFNKTWTIDPGVIIPSASGAKTIMTIGVAWNWGK